MNNSHVIDIYEFNERLINIISSKRYSIPIITGGNDLMACAQTGLFYMFIFDNLGIMINFLFNRLR